MVLVFKFWLCIWLLVLMQVPYRRKCLILSSPFINKFLSIIRGGTHFAHSIETFLVHLKFTFMNKVHEGFIITFELFR